MRELGVVRVMLHVPAATLAVQVAAEALSLIVTLPVGVPVPGLFGVTVKFTATACPGFDGSGVSAVIAVVVLALFTVCATPEETALALKLLSPL